MRRSLPSVGIVAGLALLWGTESWSLPPSPKEAAQGILLDGPLASYTYSLSQDGYQIDVLPGLLCQQETPVPSQARVLASGTFVISDANGAPILSTGSFIIHVSPSLECPAFETDCEARDAVPAVTLCIAAMRLEAEDARRAMDPCRDEVCALLAEIREMIETAGPPDSPSPIFLADPCLPIGIKSPHLSGSGADAPIAGCSDCAWVVNELRSLRDDLGYWAESCAQAVADLQAIRQDVAEKLRNAGGLTDEQKQCLLDRLEPFEADLAATLTQADDLLASILGLDTSACEHDALVASCADCSDPPPHATAAVVLKTGRQPVGRLVGAFNKAAGRADPAEAARLRGVAARLARVENRRVLEWTFPSASKVPQMFVALRSADLPDDGNSPQVVILNARSRDEPSPPMSSGDRALLFDGYRTFLATCGRAGPR